MDDRCHYPPKSPLNPVFSQTHLEPYMIEMASSMLKRKRIKEAAAVLDNVGEGRRNLRFYLNNVLH